MAVCVHPLYRFGGRLVIKRVRVRIREIWTLVSHRGKHNDQRRRDAKVGLHNSTFAIALIKFTSR